MISDKTYPYAFRGTSGTLRFKNIWSITAAYTETLKKVQGSDVDNVLAATGTIVAGRTITSGITNPDVPRCLTVTTGGTVADIAAGNVTITGTNVEGKVISETFALTDNQNGSTTGSKVFKTVTSVQFPAADGTTATISVGYSNRIGVHHRLYPNNTTVKVLSATSTGLTAALTLQGVPTVNADAEEVENNWVQPATNPDGTTYLVIWYVYDQFATAPTNDEPVYSTSTSTSSSTSSTSTSTSSTSTSTTTTSTSTSSTSTSTTTAP
jgi:hypothetical protein